MCQWAVLHNCCLLEHCRKTDTCISLVSDCGFKAGWNVLEGLVCCFFFFVEIFAGFDVMLCSAVL